MLHWIYAIKYLLCCKVWVHALLHWKQAQNQMRQCVMFSFTDKAAVSQSIKSGCILNEWASGDNFCIVAIIVIPI